MLTVEWPERGLVLELAAGERLLDVLDERPQTGTTWGCRSGHCGTCRVRIVTGDALVHPATTAEADTLTAHGAAPSERLACQLRARAQVGVVRLASAGRSAL